MYAIDLKRADVFSVEDNEYRVVYSDLDHLNKKVTLRCKNTFTGADARFTYGWYILLEEL